MELCRNPDIQERLRQELLDSSQPLQVKDLDRFVYFQLTQVPRQSDQGNIETS